MDNSEKRSRWVSRDNLVLYASLAILLFLSYWVRIIALEDSFSYDQGIHLILARLWAAGYTPYEEIFVSYPPLFLWSMGVPWKIFNQLSALQMLMATYSLVGIVAVVYLGTVYNSRLAGIVAGTLLSFAPAYFFRSITVMGEVPSVSVAVAAIAFAEKYRRSGGWVWIVLAGSTLAVSLSLKILPFYALPFVGLVIMARRVDPWNLPDLWPQLRAQKGALLIRDLVILGGSFTLVFLLPVLFFNPLTLYEQVVGMRLVSREAQFNAFSSNNKSIVEFIFGNPGMTTLALYGLIFVVARKPKTYWPILIWFIFIWLSMYLHVPLRSKHLPIFLPVLAVFAGFAVAHIFNMLKNIKNQSWSLQSFSMIWIILTVLAMFSWNITTVVVQNYNAVPDEDEAEEKEELVERQETLAFIGTITTPDDCVIADDPVFLFRTQHLPPPELSEVSHTRIRTGYLTLEDLVQSIRTHKCHVVAIITPRFGEEVPGLSEWLAENYLGRYVQDEMIVYFAKKGADNNYTPLQSAGFGQMIELYGLRLNKQLWQKGGNGFISLYWRLKTPFQEGYIEKITLRDPAGGKAVFETTRLPFEGHFNPDAWSVNEQARETFWLNLPPDLPGQTLNIYLSLCQVGSTECLPVGIRSGQTELHIGQIVLDQ